MCTRHNTIIRVHYQPRLTGQNAPGRFVRFDRLPPFLQPGRASQGQLVEFGPCHEHELAGTDRGPTAPAESDRHRPFVTSFFLHAVVFFGWQTVRFGGHHAHTRHIAIIRHAHYCALYHCKISKPEISNSYYFTCFSPQNPHAITITQAEIGQYNYYYIIYYITDEQANLKKKKKIEIILLGKYCVKKPKQRCFNIVSILSTLLYVHLGK